LQQSHKLKEIRLRKEQQSNQKEGLVYEGKQSATQSSLSAMMNEASKQTSDEAASSWGEEILMPVKSDDMPTFFDLDQQYETDLMDTPRMLSTSMTAFELLKTSNISTSFNAMSLHPSLTSRRHPPTSSTTLAVAVVPSATATTAIQNTVVEGRNDQHYFQPLARSMSDPTPRLQQILLRQALRSNQASLVPNPGLPPPSQQQQLQQLQQPPQPLPPTSYAYAAAPQPDHDPDTDGAFGDLDME
jgi:hypothetical protein